MPSAHDLLRILTRAAGLPESWVVEVQREEDGVLWLAAQADERPTETCACGRGHWIRQGWSRGRDVRALPLGTLLVQVRLTCQRYRCTVCRRSARLPSTAMDGTLLPALGEAVVTEALRSPARHVAQRFALGVDVVRRVVDAELTRRITALPAATVRHLGIDGVRIDGEPRLALVDGDSGRYLAFHQDERPGTIRAALRGLRAPPSVITMDLSYALRAAAQRVYPEAILVADKYHVVQAANAVFERFRLAQGFDGTQALRQKRARSTQVAARLAAQGHGDLVAAWHWRNGLDRVWTASDPEGARFQLLAWLDDCPPGIRPMATGLLMTLRGWQDEISNHAAGTNASTEAANRRARYWGLVSGSMDWRRVAQRLILAPLGSELEAQHQIRLAALADAGARQKRTSTNSRSASSPPTPQTRWTRAERRKRARQKGTLKKGVAPGGD